MDSSHPARELSKEGRGYQKVFHTIFPYFVIIQTEMFAYEITLGHFLSNLLTDCSQSVVGSGELKKVFNYYLNSNIHKHKSEVAGRILI